MPGPAIYNPLVKQGVRFYLRLGLEDVNGAPVPLTDAVCKGDILNTSGAVIASLSFTHLPATEEVECYLDDTTILPDTSCIHQLPYDIYITPAGLPRRCPVSGLIAVEAAQTDLSGVAP